MLEFNDTPYGVVAFVEQIEPEEPVITIVVTGHFALVPDGVCTPLPPDKQALPRHACTYADKIGNSLFCDGDVALVKPRADCLLVGSAHAPGGVPAPFVEVEFGVGNLRKKLHVYGDRSWVRQADGSVALTRPAEFTSMPIRNELAHGGPRSEHNKHGIGFGEIGSAVGSRLPVANIVPPERVAVPWTEDEMPAGFGVLHPDFGLRARLRGTYDDEWLYRRSPFPPKDFDTAFFNGARPDQQYDGYLEGDEELHLRNLHPVHADLRSRLPGTRVRIFVHHEAAHDRPVCEEVYTVLDACFVDMTHETVRLTWRGTMHSGPVADLDQIPYVMVVEEPVDAPVRREDYIDRLQALIRQCEPDEAPASGMTEELKAEIAALNAEGIAETVKALKEAGAEAALVAEVEKQTTIDDALEVLGRYAEQLSRALPRPEA